MGDSQILSDWHCTKFHIWKTEGDTDHTGDNNYSHANIPIPFICFQSTTQMAQVVSHFKSIFQLVCIIVPANSLVFFFVIQYWAALHVCVSSVLQYPKVPLVEGAEGAALLPVSALPSMASKLDPSPIQKNKVS